MENLVDTLAEYRGRRVLITGDTGFKGSWLSLWLQQRGASVFGYALPPESKSHFNEIGLSKLIKHRDGDVRDFDRLSTYISEINPDIIFHLAAQALVIESYRDPKSTSDTNIGGSINILEAVRLNPNVKALVFITSDKCYLNKEVARGYTELDELGGYDPYSASKAAAEIVFASYAKSFFAHRSSFGAASARAGNVIGGGDWSLNRIIPDCIRSLIAQSPIEIRNPNATRPWQHVLEPLSGYITLGARLLNTGCGNFGSWNFGPPETAVHTVGEVTQRAVDEWGSGSISVSQQDEKLHEALLLQLNCDKAREQLGWAPRWDFQKTIHETIKWYKDFNDGVDALASSTEQLATYELSHHD
jgi:CDP-glucose 4,6-dehydratase